MLPTFKKRLKCAAYFTKIHLFFHLLLLFLFAFCLCFLHHWLIFYALFLLSFLRFISPQQDFSAYLAFSGIVLHNAQLYETSQLENRRNQVSVNVFLWRLVCTYRHRSITNGVYVCAGAVGSGQYDFWGAAVSWGFTEKDCRNHPILHAGPGLYCLHHWWRINGQHTHTKTQHASVCAKSIFKECKLCCCDWLVEWMFELYNNEWLFAVH